MFHVWYDVVDFLCVCYAVDNLSQDARDQRHRAIIWIYRRVFRILIGNNVRRTARTGTLDSQRWDLIYKRDKRPTTVGISARRRHRHRRTVHVQCVLLVNHRKREN